MRDLVRRALSLYHTTAPKCWCINCDPQYHKEMKLTEQEINEIEESMENDWVCGTPALMEMEKLSPITNKWMVDGHPPYEKDLNDSIQDWLIASHPNLWDEVVNDFWRSQPVGFLVDPDPSYFVKKCLERLDEVRSKV